MRRNGTVAARNPTCGMVAIKADDGGYTIIELLTDFEQTAGIADVHIQFFSRSIFASFFINFECFFPSRAPSMLARRFAESSVCHARTSSGRGHR